MLWSLTRRAGPQKPSSRPWEGYICRIVDMNFREFHLGEVRAVYAATTFSPQRGLSQSDRGRAKGRSPVLGAPTRLIQRSGRNGGGESPDRTTLTTDPNILVFKRC